MAKKKRKRRSSGRKRPPAETIPEAPIAKKVRKRSRKPKPELEPDVEPTPSAPPTKKSTQPPELAHDDREIDAGSIVRFSGVVLVLTLASMILVWFINEELVGDERAGHTPPGPMASSLPDAPAEPRLQRLPREGLGALRAQEKEELETYGWVDQRRGVVRIPIDRAIDIVAERGLPTRSTPVPDREKVRTPTDSSLEPRGGKR